MSAPSITRPGLRGAEICFLYLAVLAIVVASFKGDFRAQPTIGSVAGRVIDPGVAVNVGARVAAVSINTNLHFDLRRCLTKRRKR